MSGQDAKLFARVSTAIATEGGLYHYRIVLAPVVLRILNKT